MEKADFESIKLDNGIKVLLEHRNLPVISFVAAVPFGSGYEDVRFKGIAHFLEHMAFKGTKTKNMFEIGEILDKTGGVHNAFTDREITSYWIKLPSKHIDTSIDIISDIMLNPIFEQKEMNKERKVILEELKMYHDNPISFSHHKIEELLFKKPFGTDIGGSPETLNKITRQDMFKSHEIYIPQNITIAVVGKFDSNEVLNIIKEKFRSEKKAIKLNPAKVERINSTFSEKRKNINQANIAFGFHAPSMREKEKYAYKIFNIIYGGCTSSRLFREIRDKRGLAYRARSLYASERSYGEIIVGVGTMKDKVKQVKEIVLKEWKKMSQLKNKEFEEAKEQLIGLRNVSQEESDEVAGDLIMEELAGNAEDYYKYDDFISAVKIEDVRKIARLKDYSYVEVIPEK